MTELKQLRDFAEQLNGIRPQERSLKGVVNSLIQNYNPEIVANPELDGTEPFLRGLQMGNAKYSANDDNKLSLSVVPFFDANDIIKTLIPAIVIKDYIANYSGIWPNIVSVKIFIKDETSGELQVKNIANVNTALRINGIYYYKDRGANVRYAYSVFNSFYQNPDYSEHIISMWGTIEYRYMEGDNEIKKLYGTEVCAYQLPVIEEAEPTKSGTKSSANEIDEIETLGEESIGTTK